MSEWRPIETAPEGQWALITEPSGTWMTVAVRRGGVWLEFCGSVYLREVTDMSATHWQPLPDPPEANPAGPSGTNRGREDSAVARPQEDL